VRRTEPTLALLVMQVDGGKLPRGQLVYLASQRKTLHDTIVLLRPLAWVPLSVSYPVTVLRLGAMWKRCCNDKQACKLGPMRVVQS